MRGLAGLVLFSLLVSGASAAAQTPRPIIQSDADLPPTRFPAPVPPSEIVMGETFLTQALPAYRAEAERLLRDYDIQDPTIAARLRGGLIAIAALQGRAGDAKGLVREQQAAETKPQLQQVGGLVSAALVDSLSVQPQQRCRAAAEAVSARLANATPQLVRDEVLGEYGAVQSSARPTMSPRRPCSPIRKPRRRDRSALRSLWDWRPSAIRPRPSRPAVRRYSTCCKPG